MPQKLLHVIFISGRPKKVFRKKFYQYSELELWYKKENYREYFYKKENLVNRNCLQGFQREIEGGRTPDLQSHNLTL
jgi:hypothetical protein